MSDAVTIFSWFAGLAVLTVAIAHSKIALERHQNRHVHDWDTWEQVSITRSIPPIINKGQDPVVIHGTMQKRRCKSCGEIEMKDI